MILVRLIPSLFRWAARVATAVALVAGGYAVFGGRLGGGSFGVSIPPRTATGREVTVVLLWSLAWAMVGLFSVAIAYGVDGLAAKSRANTVSDLIVLFLCACWMALVATALILALFLGSP